MNKLLGIMASAFSIAGCISNYNDNGVCTDLCYPSDKALPCPLCKKLPTIRKSEVDLAKRSFRPPEGLTAPYYLHSIGCRNENCMVRKSLGYAYWTEDAAVAEWNRQVKATEK